MGTFSERSAAEPQGRRNNQQWQAGRQPNSHVYAGSAHELRLQVHTSCGCNDCNRSIIQSIQVQVQRRKFGRKTKKRRQKHSRKTRNAHPHHPRARGRPHAHARANALSAEDRSSRVESSRGKSSQVSCILWAHRESGLGRVLKTIQDKTKRVGLVEFVNRRACARLAYWLTHSPISQTATSSRPPLSESLSCSSLRMECGNASIERRSIDQTRKSRAGVAVAKRDGWQILKLSWTAQRSRNLHAPRKPISFRAFSVSPLSFPTAVRDRKRLRQACARRFSTAAAVAAAAAAETPPGAEPELATAPSTAASQATPPPPSPSEGSTGSTSTGVPDVSPAKMLLHSRSTQLT